MTSLRNIFFIALVILILIFTNIINTRTSLPPLNISKQTSALNVNKSVAVFFSVGNRRLLSSLIWVQTLLESDIEHYENRTSTSWMFNRFDTITHLDPKFYQAYLFGGQYLSIVKDDLLGASLLYDKGIKQFPEDFWLNYHAAFNYCFELGDFTKGTVLYEKVLNHPQAMKLVPYLPVLVARIKKSTDQSEVAFSLLYSSYKKTPDESSIKPFLYNKLYSLRSEIDLRCLNSQYSNCNQQDLEGNFYIRGNDGKYSAIKKWHPLGAIRKKK